jgi:flagellar biogenesis protein FliO
MTRRVGNFLYRLGSLIAVLAIVAAVIWNVSAFNQRQHVRENFNSQFKTDLGSTFVEDSIAGRRVTDEFLKGLAQQVERSRAATENLKQSITFGGVLVIIGLIAYALGLAARSASRKPE